MNTGWLLSDSTEDNTCVARDAVVKHDKIYKKTTSRWAIVALTRPGKADIYRRNVDLANKLQPYSKNHNITFVFFSEDEIPIHTIDNWRRLFKDVGAVRVVNTASNGFNLKVRYGYKYMCKFFAYDMYEYLKDQYDYYMRVDSDCYIHKLNYDIMQWFEDNNGGYGFAARKKEAHGETVQTLPRWSQKYVDNCHIKPTGLMDFPFESCFNFYNNWHLGRVSFFTRPDVHHFLSNVNSSNGILDYRWGDSTIQAYAVRIFMDQKEILQVPSFEYTHGSHNIKVSTFDAGFTSEVPQKLPFWKNK